VDFITSNRQYSARLCFVQHSGALLVTDGVTPGGQDVTADGEKFLINTLGAEAAASPITVALNWQAGPKKYFPGAA
jgi:hypothetical protein